MPNTLAPPEIHYPSGDGEPMAETHIHVRAIVHLNQAMEDFFRDREDVFIASDIFWYWMEGNSDLKISPDVMVVLGVRPRDPTERRSFYSWEEEATPSVVFEMASEGTWRKDLGEKRDRYQKLKVPEYFIFDPEVLYLKVPILGFRLIDGVYAPIRPVQGNAFKSDLGFELRAEDLMLRVIDSKTNTPILTRAEQVRAAMDQLEESRSLANAESRRAAAESRRAAAESRRADVEQQKAEAATERASASEQRAEALALEVERLKKQLGRSGP